MFLVRQKCVFSFRGGLNLMDLVAAACIAPHQALVTNFALLSRRGVSRFAALMSQFATSKPGRGGCRKLPLAFTEVGAIMAATALNSPRDVEAEVSIYAMRAFVRLR